MTGHDRAVEVVPQFEPLVGQSGVHVHDPVEDVQAMLFTDQPVTPESTTTDQFTFPVDSAVKIDVSQIRTAFMLLIYVRDTNGNLIKEINPDESAETIPQGEYLLEFTGMEMKIYARVTTERLEITPAEGAVSVNLEGESKVVLGARSFHSQPARTLTTTSDPTNLMQAVSLFGNAMKTWSPERTFPSLRGQPPLLDLGPKCEIPKDLSPPCTEIEIRVPADHSWLYPVAPLAYWLGATVKPGNPTLLAGKNQFSLGRDAGYEAETEREAFERHVRDILQFTFLFDCAVRTEGFYNVELDARRRVEAIDLPLDYKYLYDASLADRVRTYMNLDISFQELASRIGRPGWRLTADVQRDPKRAKVLPFLARDLAVVRCPSDSRIELSSDDSQVDVADVFTRSYEKSSDAAVGQTQPLTTRSSTREPSSRSGNRERIIGLPEADSMSQAWVGDGFAIGAAKASTRSYLQRIEKHAEQNSGISINVVVNDEEMADEASVSDIYGTREHLDFDITVQQNLTTNDLAEVFESDTDFVHYIGHVDPEGFDCIDGYLDANQLTKVGADTFVLNACASYEQGQRLIDQGAIAGVVTLEDVINSLATKVGKTVARLLNYGFPIGGATSLVQETIFTGSNYAVVGDSNAALAQSNVPVPNVARISLRKDGRFNVNVETFASWNYDIGSMYHPYIEGCDCSYIVPGSLDTWCVADDALNEFLDISSFPVVGCGNLYWSDDITATTLRERLQSYD